MKNTCSASYGEIAILFNWETHLYAFFSKIVDMNHDLYLNLGKNGPISGIKYILVFTFKKCEVFTIDFYQN